MEHCRLWKADDHMQYQYTKIQNFINAFTNSYTKIHKDYYIKGSKMQVVANCYDGLPNCFFLT